MNQYFSKLLTFVAVIFILSPLQSYAKETTVDLTSFKDRLVKVPGVKNVYTFRQNLINESLICQEYVVLRDKDFFTVTITYTVKTSDNRHHSIKLKTLTHEMSNMRFGTNAAGFPVIRTQGRNSNLVVFDKSAVANSDDIWRKITIYPDGIKVPGIQEMFIEIDLKRPNRELMTQTVKLVNSLLGNTIDPVQFKKDLKASQKYAFDNKQHITSLDSKYRTAFAEGLNIREASFEKKAPDVQQILSNAWNMSPLNSGWLVSKGNKNAIIEVNECRKPIDDLYEQEAALITCSGLLFPLMQYYRSFQNKNFTALCRTTSSDQFKVTPDPDFIKILYKNCIYTVRNLSMSTSEFQKLIKMLSSTDIKSAFYSIVKDPMDGLFDAFTSIGGELAQQRVKHNTLKALAFENNDFSIKLNHHLTIETFLNKRPKVLHAKLKKQYAGIEEMSVFRITQNEKNLGYITAIRGGGKMASQLLFMPICNLYMQPRYLNNYFAHFTNLQLGTGVYAIGSTEQLVDSKFHGMKVPLRQQMVRGTKLVIVKGNIGLLLELRNDDKDLALSIARKIISRLD